MIIKIIRPLPDHAASDESFQRTKSVAILRRDKADGISDRLRSSGSPDAVHIVFRMHGKIEIDDVRNAVDVNASSRDIGRHEHADLSGFEGFQRTQPLVLRTIRMKGGRRDLRSSQALRDSVGAVLSPGENKH
jgi:hypothetical protein